MAESASDCGGLEPGFDHGNLPKETLIELLRAYSDYIRMIDGYWYLEVMNRCGNDVAFKCDSAVWERLTAYTMEMTSRLLGIRGDDVATVVRALQTNPWSWAYRCEADVRDTDYAVVSYLNCPTLLALEKEGLGREELICHQLEVRLMQVKAHYFNPDIEVTPLKLPPRQPGSELCCQWELKLERKT